MPNRPRHMRLGMYYQPVGRHPAAWRHPAGQGHPESFAWAMEVARKAESGLFDMFFMGDGLVGPTPQGNGKGGGFEPLTLLGALAAVTTHIGLVATVSTSFSEPFNVARMFASLDHISGGRVGWNVVTSYMDRAAQNFGQNALAGHAERYQRCAEYVTVVKGLWDSWDDGALRLDKESGQFVDMSKIHDLNHKGPFYSVRGPLNVSRPPQGHPVIVQAGSSADGIDVAGEHADVVFTAQDTVEESLAYRTRLRAAAQAYRPVGPDPVVMPGFMPIVGRTHEEAVEKFAALQATADIQAGLRQLSSRWGYDLSGHDLSGEVPEPGANVHGQSRVQLLLAKARQEGYTLRQLAAFAIASSGHRIVVGSPVEIADDLQHWFETGAADGFNLIAADMPAGLFDFIDLVVPELQRRGLFRTAYEGQTLRDRLGLNRPARNALA